MTPPPRLPKAPRLTAFPGDEPILSVVVPLLDEEENIRALHERIAAVLREIEGPAEVVYVDDGSTDATPDLLTEIARDDQAVAVVYLSRNFGHQAAVSAGLDHARGRAVVVMDGDMQDPPELIPTLLEKWREGFDVVYAVRKRRKEAWPKRACYALFYRLQRRLGDLEMPLDSGDFGLMDRRVVEVIRKLPERARFVRGLRAFVGFRQTGVEYDREARGAGAPKYDLRRLVGLGVDGLVSFSAAPLRLVTWMGITTALLALGLAGWAVLDAISRQTAPRGWASLIVVVLFMGAVQLVSLGLIGEYIRLIFLETKGRPSYIVDAFRPSTVANEAENESRPMPRRVAGGRP
jgi:dolichol-phosphate mannosyltransferase